MKIFGIEVGRKKVRDEYLQGTDGFVSRWARPPSRNTSEWLDMFSKSPRLAVVDRIASDLAGISGRLLRIEADGSETEVLDHPFLDFMAQPNPLYEMTSSAMWRLHEIYLLLVGESFFLIERDESGRPVELWNVPPHWVRMTPYLGNPYYQIISADGMSMNVPVDDMFVMKQLNPLDPFMRGLGSAESIADEVEIDEYAAKFQKRFFYNDATPPVVFLMPDASPDQRDAFMARWNQKHRGVDNSHRAAALSGNVDVKLVGGTNYGTNLGFLESREAMRDAVLEHFGVPREIMGITENSNRATADAAQYIYAKNVLTPKLMNREEAINKQLLPLFGSNLVWRYDPIIPYDRDFDKAKALDAYNAGLITRNEARELMDMPDIEGGDVYKLSINDLFINAGDDPVAVSNSLLQDTSTPMEEWQKSSATAFLKKAAAWNERLHPRGDNGQFVPSGGGGSGGGSGSSGDSSNESSGSSGGSGGDGGSGNSNQESSNSGTYQSLVSDDDANAYWAAVDSGEIDPSDTSTIPDWWSKESSQMQVTDAERSKINSGYVGNEDSYDINSAMRASPDKPLNEILSGEKLETAQALESAIAKNTLSQDTTLTRYVSEDFLDSAFGLSEKDFFAIQTSLDENGNLDSPEMKSMLDQFKGGVIKDNSFVSTSANPILNAFNYYPMQIEIQAPAGTHAYITDNFKESEVILHKPTLRLKEFSSYDYKDEYNLDDNGEPIVEKRLKVIFGVEE